MFNRKSFIILILSLTGFFGIPQNIFAVHFAIMDVATTFPPVALMGNEIVGEYIVTDGSKVRLAIEDQSILPAGTTIQSDTGYCGNAIILDSRFSPGNSCIASFKLPAQNAITQLNGQIKKYIAGTDVYLVSSPFNIQIVDTPQPGMPVLSLFSNQIFLTPGVPRNIAVTNDSATTVANNVQFFLFGSIVNSIESTTGCSSIAPLATCQMNIKAKSDALPTHSFVPMFIQGANTYGAYVFIIIVETGTITPEASVPITSPGVTNLLLTNSEHLPAHVTAVTLGSSLHGITADFSGCSEIPAFGGTCNIVLSSTVNSYGSDNAIITYHFQEDVPITKTAESNIIVSNPPIALYDSDNNLITSGEIKVEHETSPQTYKFKNIGNFNWQVPTISLAPLTGVTLSACSSGTPIAPNSSCTFTLDTDQTAVPGSSAVLSATGNNISQVDTNIIVSGGLAMTPDLDAVDLHLGYRAVKIDNMTSSVANIQSVVIDEALAGVAYCSPSDATCAYKTDSNCDADGGILAAGGECKIWFKALDSTTLNTQTGAIGITVTALWPGFPTPVPETEYFTGYYDHSLYVGSHITLIGVSGNIFKWNGSAWSSIGVANSYVRSLAIMKGDLYAGGDFTNFGSYIARWNGNNWSGVGGGVNNYVTALFNLNDILYVGGYFTQAGGVGGFNYVAKWNSDTNTWYTMGTGLGGGSAHAVTLAAMGTDLYVGGLFSTAGGVTVNNIAKWNTNTNAWSALGTGTNNTVNSIATMGGIVYAGGTFGTPYSRMAKWNGSAWSAVGSGPGGIVNALTPIGANLYVGTDFSPFIRKWDSSASTWSTVGSGLDGTVLALTSLGTDLYIGGAFTHIIGNPNISAYVTKWDTLASAWTTFGTALSGFVLSATTAPSLRITKP